MVINREFFFRGWLPAGLIINARLAMSSSSDGETVLRPVLNPSPESYWHRDQPSIVFPVSQATDNKAILLKDPIPDGAIVMLPLGEWYGSGTPFILATNVWYEGRIQEVSGGDVMAVRIDGSFTLSYYSYYSGIATPDVKLRVLPCRWIPGMNRDQRAFKDTNSLLSELGFVPTVKSGESDVALPILDIKKVSQVDLAGMRPAYSTQSPAGEAHIIQCEVIAGPSPLSSETKFVGLIGASDRNVQTFYTVMNDGISAKVNGPGLIKSQTIGVFFTHASDDQVIHYN